MGSKSYDSYSGMSKGGKSSVPPSQTDTKKFAGGYDPQTNWGSGNNVKGSRLPKDGANRRGKRSR